MNARRPTTSGAGGPPGLDRVVARLAAGLAPERIVLFGSWARGCAHPGSDVDLLVVADWAGGPDLHARRARHLVAGAFPRVDLVLCQPEKLAPGGEGPDSAFLRSAVETGLTVYDRRA